MNQQRVTTKHRRHLRELHARIVAATDPGSPGGTSIVASELPDILDGLDGAHAGAAVIDLTDGLRATSPERFGPMVSELAAWVERLPIEPDKAA